MEVKPVQLISFDRDRQLRLNPVAAALLQGWSERVRQLAIISVVGKYRTGKSFILNRVLLSRNSGFEVGPTINACTKGLWIWPELVEVPQPNGEVLHCVVMDTEGLGSLEQGENADIKVFLMALLLSSYFIYNSMGSIDEKAVSNLSLVVNLGKLLSSKGSRDMEEIIKCFPSFLWLVRDFALRLVDAKDRPITPTQYLENALRMQPTKSEQAQRKNKVREELVNFFKERDCFILIRPTDDEAKLQKLSSLSDADLRPEFLELVAQLRAKVFSQVRRKSFKGKSCSPSMLIEMCNFFCQAINSGDLPEIENSWDQVCKAQAQRVLTSCSAKFTEYLEGTIGSSDLRELSLAQFQQNTERKMAEIAKFFERSSMGEKQSSRQELKKKFKKMLEEAKAKIVNAKVNSIDQAITQHSETLLASIENDSLQSGFDITQPFQQVIDLETRKNGKNYELNCLLYQKAYEQLRACMLQYSCKLSSRCKNLESQYSLRINKAETSSRENETDLLKRIELLQADNSRLEAENRRQKLVIQDSRVREQRYKLESLARSKNSLLELNR